MLDETLTVILLCSLVAVSGAMLGTFLVLRRMAMMADAISHSILLGIVLAFLIFKSTDSLIMIIAAAAAGMLTIYLTETLLRTRLVREDTSIGLVFPLLFSIGVILIAQRVRGLHLDIDVALVGDPTFAWIDTVSIAGLEISRPVVIMAIITVVNVLFVAIFYKELKLTTFDAGLATALGFAPGLIGYGLMGLLSVTAVGAFDAVGAVLFVAFIVITPAAAYLLTDHLWRMMVIASIFGVVACAGGYALALAWEASISGCIVVALGVIFGLTLVFAPSRGLLAGYRRRRRQKWEFAARMLIVHLLNHEGHAEESRESTLSTLPDHLRWTPIFLRQIVRRADRSGWVQQLGDQLALTEPGRQAARQMTHH